MSVHTRHSICTPSSPDAFKISADRLFQVIFHFSSGASNISKRSGDGYRSFSAICMSDVDNLVFHTILCCIPSTSFISSVSVNVLQSFSLIASILAIHLLVTSLNSLVHLI